MDWPTISMQLALIACAVGLAGVLSTRDKKTRTDAEWRGRNDAKLDSILASVTGLRSDVERIDTRLHEYGERLVQVEGSVKQAHKRLDASTK